MSRGPPNTSVCYSCTSHPSGYFTPELLLIQTAHYYCHEETVLLAFGEHWVAQKPQFFIICVTAYLKLR